MSKEPNNHNLAIELRHANKSFDKLLTEAKKIHFPKNFCVVSGYEDPTCCSFFGMLPGE